MLYYATMSMLALFFSFPKSEKIFNSDSSTPFAEGESIESRIIDVPDGIRPHCCLRYELTLKVRDMSLSIDIP